MITATREEVIANIRYLLDVSTGKATRAVKYLEDQGIVFQPPVNSPCRACGKPWDTRSCSMGGCPLGADL